jgi:RNA polymerase sigma factor (sigma-70 family)
VDIKEEEIPKLIHQGKDKEVVPLLYKKVFPIVRKYIVSHNGIKEDAFDVFQDALIEFYSQAKKGTYNEKYKVFGYLFRLSTYKWINKIKRDRKVIYKEDMMDFDTQEKEEYLLLGKNEDVLKSLFSPIGEKCIELLTHTVFHNLLMEDIALRMGFPSVAAVKMKHLRCREKLIEEVNKNPALINRLKGQ